ncbi:hypothetical protein A2797_01370 [candidate division WWE3 bacterium RIFCSPHIGHO2_01_FULL_48_15]|uniref:Uncharacterized protein n=1 Tax=candidate division WWE3 bacterium RIFCSPHIGHO2_01_FULL_48_15 TaxID=1802619 RepID=A0A1F4VFU7_UNCKA|nr:MAG: hypothetical protein A2797_01370 [candidate division WWE3 bacterium RIFCSPHIGHO2_01_FULL_48_15]
MPVSRADQLGIYFPTVDAITVNLEPRKMNDNPSTAKVNSNVDKVTIFVGNVYAFLPINVIQL